LNDAVRRRLGGWNTAELIITAMNFAFSADCVRNGNWDAMADYLSDRARALQAGGADIFLCVSNTLHKVADRADRAAARAALVRIGLDLGQRAEARSELEGVLAERARIAAEEPINADYLAATHTLLAQALMTPIVIFRQGDAAAARTMLEDARPLIGAGLPSNERGTSWDWLAADLLAREARALIENPDAAAR
jgi:hypothetical protein